MRTETTWSLSCLESIRTWFTQSFITPSTLSPLALNWYKVIKVIIQSLLQKEDKCVRYIKKRYCCHWWVKVIPSWSLKSAVDQISLCFVDIFGNNSSKDSRFCRADQSSEKNFSNEPMRGIVPDNYILCGWCKAMFCGPGNIYLYVSI